VSKSYILFGVYWCLPCRLQKSSIAVRKVVLLGVSSEPISTMCHLPGKPRDGASVMRRLPGWYVNIHQAILCGWKRDQICFVDLRALRSCFVCWCDGGCPDLHYHPLVSNGCLKTQLAMTWWLRPGGGGRRGRLRIPNPKVFLGEFSRVLGVVFFSYIFFLPVWYWNYYNVF